MLPNNFKRLCQWCGEKIRMVQNADGSWNAWNLDCTEHHHCQQPYSNGVKEHE